MNTFLEILIKLSKISALIIIIALAIMIAIFIITTALYIPVKKSIKYNLKKAEDYTEEQRIYLDKYHYTVENEDLNNQLKDKKDMLRKAAAELKSLEAEITKIKEEKEKKEKKK